MSAPPFSFIVDLTRARAFGSGPGLRSALELMRSPGVHAVAAYRFGSWCTRQPGWARLSLDPFYLVASVFVQILWGIEISRHARIGPGLYIGHFGGINVSRHAIIGANCALSQGVTIGVEGRGERSGAPVIGDDVYIGPGARLFGRIRVGNNVKIGANAVVHRDIPDNAIVVVAGFQILSYRGNHSSTAATPATQLVSAPLADSDLNAISELHQSARSARSNAAR